MKATSLVVVLLTLLTACTGTKVKVKIDEFSATAHQAYAWGAEPIKNDIRKGSYFYLDHYVRRFVDRALAAKGYQLSAKAEADFVVEYRYLQHSTPDQGGIISPLDAQDAAWDNGRDVNETALYHHYVPAEILRGNLAILLDDAKTGKTIWQGVASKIVEGDINDKRAIKRAMEHIIPKLLASVPSR